ncbi:MAG TPA: acetyl-CoA carboxylase biotin carboxyl carrier protein [Candidatus Omnitrophota bacterium]|nr:acetyl-CoA carboxylase biotin carboxyl carrier protein [Candidatus Omnitrophota bacterium]HPS19984.1 acetyl-CoA carboxylase biotin carboxyl carrier protein [Candidatus Omnitrophota bacterium]
MQKAKRSDMNIKKIQELIELMNNNDLAEIAIEQEGSKVKLVKKGAGSAEQRIISIPQAVSAQQSAAEAIAQPASAEKNPENNKNLSEIKAPMVGTFYRAPSPEAEPYAQVGNIIHKGDVLCIVEAMKLMNEVKSEIDGKIMRILVENAEPVEFGQVMFLVEPL